MLDALGHLNQPNRIVNTLKNDLVPNRNIIVRI